jgi:DNA-binding response OmpR family regulator
VGQEMGANVYMTKPFDPNDLMDKIKGVLAAREG